MTVVRTNIWQVTIQYVAPGDFPQTLYAHFQVPADTFEHALAKAQKTEQNYGLDPQILGVVRIKPVIP
jgi:hypothetical protein